MERIGDSASRERRDRAFRIVRFRYDERGGLRARLRREYLVVAYVVLAVVGRALTIRHLLREGVPQP